jgi:undecaprenyl diphosphate synthase
MSSGVGTRGAVPVMADTGSSAAGGSEPNTSLRHVLIVGGTLAEWAALTPEAWRTRTQSLGALCDQLGVPWLTIRAYERGDDADAVALHPWRTSVEGCGVLVDPSADGRERFADAMSRLDDGDEVNEASVAAVLYEPADSEPDLVVVLGPSTQLPPSLVWELAYAELVFIPVDWADLTAEHLARAMADFSGRRRRFGGLDE